MESYRIAVVYALGYGDELQNLAEKMHVWAVSSPTNDLAARSCWDRQSSLEKYALDHGATYDLEHGITLFEDAPFDVQFLDTLWDHHGIHAHDPPLSEILVAGKHLTPKIRLDIDSYGLEIIEENENFFVLKTRDQE